MKQAVRKYEIVLYTSEQDLTMRIEKKYIHQFRDKLIISEMPQVSCRAVVLVNLIFL